jgi:hypothetical protein
LHFTPHALRYLILAILTDHAEQVSEFQAEEVQWVFGAPQVSSGSDANIIVIKASPDAFNHAPYLLIFNLALCSIMIVY